MNYIKRLYYKKSIGRKEFFLLNVVPATLFVTGFLTHWYTYLPAALFVVLLFAFAISWLFIYGISVVKRSADIGINPGWNILAFFPYLNWLYVLYLLIAKGKPVSKG